MLERVNSNDQFLDRSVLENFFRSQVFVCLFVCLFAGFRFGEKRSHEIDHSGEGVWATIRTPGKLCYIPRIVEDVVPKSGISATKSNDKPNRIISVPVCFRVSTVPQSDVIRLPLDVRLDGLVV